MNQGMRNTFDDRCCSNVWTKFLSLMNVLELAFYGYFTYCLAVALAGDISYAEYMIDCLRQVFTLQDIPEMLVKLVPECFMAITMLLAAVSLILKIRSTAAALFAAFGTKSWAWRCGASYHGFLKWSEIFSVITCAMIVLLNVLAQHEVIRNMPITVYSNIQIDPLRLLPLFGYLIVCICLNGCMRKTGADIAKHIDKDLPPKKPAASLAVTVISALLKTAFYAALSYALVVINHGSGDSLHVMDYLIEYVPTPIYIMDALDNALFSTLLAFYALKQLVGIPAYLRYYRLASN